jgi:Ankyrin repeats (many copies)
MATVLLPKRAYYPGTRGAVLRTRERTLALVSAALIAASPAYAQQAQQEPQAQPAPAEQAFPERVIDGIRGFFRSMFGQDKADPAAPEAQPQPPQSPAPAQAQTEEEKPAFGKRSGASYAQPVAVTPHASPSLSLQGAIAKGDYVSALKMIEGGADIEAKDPGAGATALHYAVMKGDMPLVALLVQRGADVNSRTKSGTTPLHTAVLYGRYEVSEYLLGKGAEIDARSVSGATPLSLADAARFERIAKMLREHGAH